MKRFTQRTALTLILSLLTLAASGCREDGLVGVEGLLQFRPSTLEFDPRYEGLSQEKSFVVANDGRATLELKWTDPTGVPEAPGDALVFALLDPLPELLPPGETTIRVRFDAAHPPGNYETRLIASTKEGNKAITLKAEIVKIPDCQADDPCRTFHFDTALERCVPTAKEDGIACSSDNKCLTSGTCHAGVCTGKSITCDDGNACTVDVCDSQNGCMFFPGPPCPGDGKCMVGACNRDSGCFMEPAMDGTSCGSLSSCVAADVCIEGTCVVRDPPDGFICEEASPCQDASRCQNDVCVKAPKTPLTANYTFDSFNEGGGNQYHDLALEPSGAMSLFGVFSQPILRATTSPVLLDGFARRCMMWNGRALCLDAGDANQRTRQGNVSLVDPATGQLLWSFSLAEARPDIVAGAGVLFMGRAAIAGTDRFAALFEAYRIPAPQNEAERQCRRYFLIVLNTSGQLVNAHEVTDPSLELCNHPHPFGMAADVAGNFFISFSPSVKESNGALIPEAPTLLMAFARDGTPKWRRNLDIAGGELAVGRGLLFPERSTTPIRTADGTDLPASSADFGRPGITAEHVLAAPRLLQNTLEGRPLETASAWTYQLPQHFVWSTDQLRLASYKPRQTEPAEPIVVSFAHSILEEEQHPRLVGIRARDGQQQFMCEVEYAPWPMGTEGSPQLFEVGKEGIALMDGTPACGRCDPPYAGTSLGGPPSHGRFFRFTTPTLSPATAPWPGAFGGENHDHQENTLLQIPVE